MAGYIGSRAAVVSNGAERKKTYAITGTTTSLTGLNYTVNQVHVFHNGVRLVDGTDFTATNGNSITLTTAAEAGDEVVVISYATYQTSDTVSASLGGTFSGALDVNEDGATVLTVDRATSDGTIIDVQKAGSTVGSIGVTASDNLYVSSTATDHAGLVFNNTAMGPWVNDAASDNTMDVGTSVNRFKDLYLSGGVNIYNGATDAIDIRGTGSRCEIDNPANNAILLKTGGTTRVRIDANGLLFGSDTAAANALDDYEEGTFTISLEGSSGNPTYTGGNPAYYTKIGRLVHFYWYSGSLSVSSAGSGNLEISGLPFTVSGNYSPISVAHNTLISGGATAGYFSLNTDDVYLQLDANRTSVISASSLTSGYIMISGTYIAA